MKAKYDTLYIRFMDNIFVITQPENDLNHMLKIQESALDYFKYKIIEDN